MRGLPKQLHDLLSSITATPNNSEAITYQDINDFKVSSSQTNLIYAKNHSPEKPIQEIAIVTYL